MTARVVRKKLVASQPAPTEPPADPDLDRMADQNVAALQATLKAKIGRSVPAPSPSPTGDPKPAQQVPAPAVQQGTPAKRTIPKIVLGLCVAVAFGWFPVQRLLQLSSVEAVVNARLITLRSPIEGVVSLPEGETAPMQFARNAVILTIDNPRADQTRLDTLRRDIGRLEDEKAALATRRDKVRQEADRLAAQTEAFRQGRIRQLEARSAEIRSEIAAAQARADEAGATVSRGTTLVKSGAYTTVDLDRAKRDQIVAREQQTAATRRLEAVAVELESARDGRFIGDSYNDRPQSAQRADEVAARLEDLQERGEVIDRQLTRLTNDLATETQRAELRERAQIRSPIAARVWELLTAQGEVVQRGQDLLRLLDCSDLLVTASVTESVFNRLKLGMPARFRPAGATATLPGAVTALTGIAGPRGNFAIEPSSLAREPYRVTVTVPGLDAAGAGCEIGRTGQVLFDEPTSVAAAARGR